MRAIVTVILSAAAISAHAADVVLANLGGGSSVVTNTITNALVLKTGQTNSYATGDDGHYQTGAGTTNRFTVLTNTNAVRDNLTGLIWARNASLSNQVYWGVAVTNCNNLDYGGFTDWRLPNAHEMFSLIDYGMINPALPSGHPFANAQLSYYWTSTTRQDYPGERYFDINTTRGTFVDAVGAVNAYYMWPVRGPDPSAE